MNSCGGSCNRILTCIYRRDLLCSLPLQLHLRNWSDIELSLAVGRDCFHKRIRYLMLGCSPGIRGECEYRSGADKTSTATQTEAHNSAEFYRRNVCFNMSNPVWWVLNQEISAHRLGTWQGKTSRKIVYFLRGFRAPSELCLMSIVYL